MTANGDILMQDGCGHWLHFSRPKRIHVATVLSDIPALLEAVDAAVSAGTAVAGFLTYEFSGGIDPVLETKPVDPAAALPLAWFGEYGPPDVLDLLPPPDSQPSALSWKISVSDEEYASAIARIKSYIVAGDTYQVNFTVRMHSGYSGDAYPLFYRLQASQRSENAAFVNLGDFSICSASPELFFAVDGHRIVSRPMKGTARRGTTVADDDESARELRESPKNQAENVMIVDMIRNDLGRIAEPGSVQVTRMFDIERYPTVSQMTSTVEAETQASFAQIIRALFPCASITGAPKVRTMQIIRELEASPRGIYTGSIGYWLPGRQARFNVAIRTVLFNQADATATYGVGGGIVWDSIDSHELAECVTKAEVLKADGRDFEILETLLLTPGKGFFLLERHIARARNAAARFGYAFDEPGIRKALATCVQGVDATQRVRCLLAQDGSIEAEAIAMAAEADKTWRLGVVPNACTSTDVFLYHKTTRRDVYERARACCPDCDDVLLMNERGEITESTIANVVIDMNGERLTPPVASGLLAGTFRDELLEHGEIREAIITPDMLARADAIWLINSVRKWQSAEIIA